MPPVGFDKVGFVGCVGVGSVLVMVVKAAFGQVCDVLAGIERVLRPQCLDGLALSFAVCFLAEGVLTPLGRRPLRAY